MSTAPAIVPPPVAGALPAGPAQLVLNGELTMPVITTLEQFVEWRMSDACPERGRFAFFGNTLWVDLMSEQAYTHNRVKVAFTMTLEQVSLEQGTGTYFADGMDLLNRAASFATVPDGMYVLYDCFRSGRVVRQPNRHQVGVVRLEGTPDVVLEIVSDSSQEQDYGQRETSYHLAGIPEFWRVDVRRDLCFEIFRREPVGYVPTRQPDGWWRSDVFGRDFLLAAGVDQLGESRFTLRHRA